MHTFIHTHNTSIVHIITNFYVCAFNHMGAHTNIPTHTHTNTHIHTKISLAHTHTHNIHEHSHTGSALLRARHNADDTYIVYMYVCMYVCVCVDASSS